MVWKITETYQGEETDNNICKMHSDSLNKLNLKIIDLRLVAFSTLLQVTKTALKFKAPVRTIIRLIRAFVYPAK